MTEKRIAEAVADGIVEILDDMNDGRVPRNVPDFSSLHDYVDANEYAGLCGSRASWSTEDAAEVQDELDKWLRSRGEGSRVLALHDNPRLTIIREGSIEGRRLA